MKALWRHRPSPATVLAGVALMVALGGTGYAAVVLPANSVGTRAAQEERRHLAQGQERLAAEGGLQGRPDSRRGRQGRPDRRSAGRAGPTGPPGPAGPFPDALPAGKTIRGAYNIGGTAAAAGALADTAISFIYALRDRPDGEDRAPGGGGTGGVRRQRHLAAGADRVPLHLRGSRTRTRPARRSTPSTARGDDLRELDRGRRLLQLRHLGGDRGLTGAKPPGRSRTSRATSLLVGCEA